MVEEEKVNSMRSPKERVAHILSGLRDPLEPCMSDARRELPSFKGDELSYPVEERGDKAKMESVVKEEIARNKEVVSEPVEMQWSVPAETVLRIIPLKSTFQVLIIF